MPLMCLRSILSKTSKENTHVQSSLATRWKHGLGPACNTWLPGKKCHLTYSSFLHILFSSRMQPCRIGPQRKFCHSWKKKVVLSCFCDSAKTDPWEPHIFFDLSCSHHPNLTRLKIKYEKRGKIKGKE